MMTLPEFVARWQGAEIGERQGAQMHFLELCDVLDQPRPAPKETAGAEYCFEKGVAKTGGGQGCGGFGGGAGAGWGGRRGGGGGGAAGGGGGGAGGGRGAGGAAGGGGGGGGGGRRGWGGAFRRRGRRSTRGSTSGLSSCLRC